jgi:hypothetical protein
MWEGCAILWFDASRRTPWLQKRKRSIFTLSGHAACTALVINASSLSSNMTDVRLVHLDSVLSSAVS